MRTDERRTTTTNHERRNRLLGRPLGGLPALTLVPRYGVRKFLCRDSIYTLKLTRRGHRVPEALQANFPMVRSARDLMDKHVAVIPASAHLNALGPRLLGPEPIQFFMAEEEGHIIGVIERNSAIELLARNGAVGCVRDATDTRVEIVTENTTLLEMTSRMHTQPVSFFLVSPEAATVSATAVIGVISKGRIADAITETIARSQE